MPDTTKGRRGAVHLALGMLVGLLVGVAVQPRGRRRPAADVRPIWKPAEPPPPGAPVVELARRRRRRAFPVRLAVAAVYAVLFFAGAAVAAVAGDAIVGGAATAPDATTAAAPLDAGADPVPADTTAAPAESAPADPAPADSAPADPGPADSGPADSGPAAPAPGWTMPAEPVPAAPAAAAPAAPAQPTDTTPASDPSTAATGTDASTSDTPEPPAPAAPAPSAPASFATPAPAHATPARTSAARVTRKSPTRAAAPDASEAPASVVPLPYATLTWISRFAPPAVPQPPLLTRPFGRDVYFAAKRGDTSWPLVLGILEARGGKATPAAVRELVPRVAAAVAQHGDNWAAALGLLGDSTAADRAVALMHFDRAVGLETLVTGLDASKQRLVRRVLDDPRISIYPGGRDDLAAGRVDVRVVAVIAYLADTFGSVEVSSLVSGHRLFARPGVISAHVYGDAVDIAALGGVAIEGHQQPGGITEKAVRALLLLPQRMEPAQVISLLGLGGPSFPLADHYDHIHVGY